MSKGQKDMILMNCHAACIYLLREIFIPCETPVPVPRRASSQAIKSLNFRTTKAETLPKFSTIMKLITDILKQCKYLSPPVHVVVWRFQFLSC